MINTMSKYLIIEPFYGGSHKVFITRLCSLLGEGNCHLLTLPPKKWHWKARTSAISLYQQVPKDVSSFRMLFCSSVLCLPELMALTPQLSTLLQVVYFHENQLSFPVQDQKLRDYQFGYNDILTALCADQVLFNSGYNRDQFIEKIPSFLRKIPDSQSTLDVDLVASRVAINSSVAYFPMNFDRLRSIAPPQREGPLKLCWPHRWEHDKNPDLLCRVLTKLSQCDNSPFEVYIFGEKAAVSIPDCFKQLRDDLGGRIKQFGYVENYQDFLQMLSGCDVCISTADHEFFGVAMMEAAFLGCYPLVPNRLVYPELYPKECLYSTENQLYKRLGRMSSDIETFRVQNEQATRHWYQEMQFERFEANNFIKTLYLDDL